MAKRRMPPHIVLPNGMWRFVKRGSKSVATKRSRGVSMAKSGKKRSRGGFGKSSKLFGLSTKGLFGGLGLLGVAAAAFFADDIAKMIPVNVDPTIKKYGAAFAVGGPAGIVANVAKSYLMPSSGTSGSGLSW